MRAVRICAALCLIAAGEVAGAIPAAADDVPVLHDVTYTISTDKPFFADIYYHDTEPGNYADYSHNPYVFSPKIETDLGPDRPWVLTVRMADPLNWAMALGTSGQSPNPPGFHCTLAVDGNVLVSNSGSKGALCSMRHW